MPYPWAAPLVSSRAQSTVTTFGPLMVPFLNGLELHVQCLGLFELGLPVQRGSQRGTRSASGRGDGTPLAPVVLSRYSD